MNSYVNNCFPVCVLCLCLYNHCFIVIMYVILIFMVLNMCNFIQRTQQVLIELDSSAIEDYMLLLNESCSIKIQSEYKTALLPA